MGKQFLAIFPLFFCVSCLLAATRGLQKSTINTLIAEELPTTHRLQKSSINTWIAEEFDQHRNLGIALAFSSNQT
jgi:hypothetical protein